LQVSQTVEILVPSMPFTLHASAGSCSLAPHIVLEEIGKPFSLAMISTDRGDARTDAFKTINPKGRVPVLVNGDFSLTEAPAILLYLAQLSQESNLMPIGQDGLIRAIEWFNWLSGTVHSIAIRMIWRAEYFTMDADHTAPIKAKGFEHLRSAHTMIEERMRGKTWVVGDSYSVVDPYLLVFYRWGNRMKIDMKRQCPAWTEHTMRLSERAAVNRAIATEGISIWE
jgi:glutathione S-transferase